MICVVIKGPSFEIAYQQISIALKYADLVELRLDYFDAVTLDAIQKLRSHFLIPMIFTLRDQSQGGKYEGSEENRLTTLRSLASLEPEYIDLESHIPAWFIEELSLLHPCIKIIYSSHDFSGFPHDLDGLFYEMQRTPAAFYKIALTPKNCLEATRLLCWAKNAANNLIAIGMGPHGQLSRILAPVVGSPITYAALEDEETTNLGQIPPKILVERYHYRSLNAHTAIHGLIGDPVIHSIGHKFHNAVFKMNSLNSVYVKMQVRPSELNEFLQLAKTLPFRGLSVTMPLKELILPYLDSIDSQAEEIGAVNTLLFDNGKIHGCNTDGVGALNAIEKQCSVNGKRMVILGAGGASKAIAYVARQRGALVKIVNRHKERAQHVASRLNCIGTGFELLPEIANEGYDILINCTPLPLPVDPMHILSHTLVMDITTNPKETLFLKHAKEKQCTIVYGYQMFVEQALGQLNLWFERKNSTAIPPVDFCFNEEKFAS